jgi:predicted PurR-regulated permease PerM
MSEQFKNHPYEEGFLLFLIFIAISGLVWLFYPFIPGLFFAVFLASSTYPYYLELQTKFKNKSEMPALSMAFLVFFIVVAPVAYLLVSTGIRVSHTAVEVQAWVSSLVKSGDLKNVLIEKISFLPLPEEGRDIVFNSIINNQEKIGVTIGKVLMFLFESIAQNSSSFLASVVLIGFSLFYFYRDGPKLLHHIKVLTPLRNTYDEIIFHKFNTVATVLTLSTVSIALLQGLSFALVTAFLDLPWFYFGVFIAVASFIPAIGAFIVWGPLAYYLYMDGNTTEALFIVFWGAFVIGFLIDNLIRPLMINWLSKKIPSGEVGSDIKILSHTFLTVLATFGGIINFGILGLFFGPMIAAIAITIIDLFQMTQGEKLDRS